MNKRGAIISYAMLMWLVKGTILIFVGGAINMMILIFIAESIDVDIAEANVMETRFVYSGSSLAYVDTKIDRVYPGIVDEKKIDADDLEYVNDYPDRLLAANISLFDYLDNYERTLENGVIYNKEGWKFFSHMADAEQIGIGSAIKRENIRRVILRSGDVEELTGLKIVMLTQND